MVGGALWGSDPAALVFARGIGTVLLSSDDYATGRLFPALFGIALCFSATGVLGLAIGAFLRNSAGSITAVWVSFYCGRFSARCSVTWSAG